MDFRPENAKPGYRVEERPLPGWKTAPGQWPASLSAGSTPPYMGSLDIFSKSVVNSSMLDPSLAMDVECWSLVMPDQLPPSEASRISHQYSVLASDDQGMARVNVQDRRHPEFSPRDNASRPSASTSGRVPIQEFYSPIKQGISFEYSQGPATWLPVTPFGASFIPSPSAEEIMHNHLAAFQNSIPWQVTTPNRSSSEVFASFLTSGMMMTPLQNATSGNSSSRVQSYSSAIENRSPSFLTDVFQLSDSSPDKGCEPSSIPLAKGDSNVFVSGSSDKKDDEFNFTWTKVEATPAGSLHHQLPMEAGSLNFDAGFTTSIDIISQIQLDAPPKLPRPEEEPPTMDELVVNFESSPGVQPSKRKRKAFSKEDRKKVKRVRQNGACFSCRARKVSCTEEGVCSRCLTAARDPLLACQVCLRNKFKDIYIGVKDIHGSLWARKRHLGEILGSLIGTPKEVVIWVSGAPNIAKLKIQVMQCQSPAKCRWKCLRKENGIYITSHFVHDQRYVILPSSLPSIDQLDLFGRQILSFSDGSHSGMLTPLLDVFLLHYCRPNRPSRLRQLADKTLRVASLNGLVAYGFIDLHDGSYDLLSRPPSNNQRYVSETVHDQIRLLAAEGFGTAEEFIFRELDNLREIIGSSEHNRIVAGICLLRLVVLYRERMVRDEIRLGLPRNGKRKTGHQTRLEKAAFMYKRLTVVYGTLCRGNDSPMTMPFQSESTEKTREDDSVLRTALLGLQAAYKGFCDKKLTQQHDDVFKRLIVEPARKTYEKGSKRRGLANNDSVCDAGTSSS